MRSTTASRLIADAAQTLLTLRTQESCSDRYLESLGYELARFTKAFHEKTLADITTPDIAHYLRDAATAGARNTRRKHLVKLFLFGLRNKWVKENPAKEVSRLREKFDIETLTLNAAMKARHTLCNSL